MNSPEMTAPEFYLTPMIEANIDYLVLGCTPFILSRK
jgi:glutamate racemase